MVLNMGSLPFGFTQGGEVLEPRLGAMKDPNRVEKFSRQSLGCVVRTGLYEGEKMNRRTAIRRLATFFLTTASLAEAQQAGKIFRIGYLDNSTASSRAALLEAFRQELRKLGWIEGKNLIIEYRFAEGKNDRLPELAAELVRLKVELIVTSGGPTPSVAKNVTSIEAH